MKTLGWIVLLALLLRASPATPEETREWLDKEKAVLDLKRQLLDAEFQKFELDKKEWEINKRAEKLARETYRLDLDDLPLAIRRRDVLNRLVSEHFSEFLNREDGGGASGKLMVLKVRVGETGKVLAVDVEKSDLPEKLEKKITGLARSLDYSKLGSSIEPFEHRFPLVIRR